MAKVSPSKTRPLTFPGAEAEAKLVAGGGTISCWPWMVCIIIAHTITIRSRALVARDGAVEAG
jgi:hypothetical protein